MPTPLRSIATSPHAPLLAAFAGAAIISFSALIFELSGVSPSTGTFFRSLYALVVVQCYVFLTRTAVVRTGRERAVAFAGGIFLAADVWIWQTAMGHIGTGLATLTVNSQVVIVPLLAWAVLGERPAGRALVSMPAVMGGLVLITGLGAADAFGSDPVLGVALATGAALCYSAFLMLYRQANTSLGPVVRVLGDVLVGSTVGALITGLASGDLDFAPAWPAHGWLLVLAIGPQVFGWLLIGYALPRLPSAHTSFAILLQPSLTLAWGALLLTERPSPIQWLGVGVVLAGIAAVTVPVRRRSAVA